MRARLLGRSGFEPPRLRPNVVLDEFVILPNHIHGILYIVGGPHALDELPGRSRPNEAQSTFRSPAGTVGAIVRGFKAATTSLMRKHGGPSITIWQRQFYDHIVRNDADMNRIREYIVDNPRHWNQDRFFVNNLASPDGDNMA